MGLRVCQWVRYTYSQQTSTVLGCSPLGHNFCLLAKAFLQILDCPLGLLRVQKCLSLKACTYPCFDHSSEVFRARLSEELGKAGASGLPTVHSLSSLPPPSWKPSKPLCILRPMCLEISSVFQKGTTHSLKQYYWSLLWEALNWTCP